MTKTILLSLAITSIQPIFSVARASPLPPIAGYERIHWGMTRSALEALLHRKLIEQKVPGEYDGGVATIYGLSAIQQLEVGNFDGLRAINLRISTTNVNTYQEQVNIIHGHMEADLGRPVADNQETTDSESVITLGTEWRWPDGSVLLLPQPGN